MQIYFCIHVLSALNIQLSAISLRIPLGNIESQARAVSLGGVEKLAAVNISELLTRAQALKPYCAAIRHTIHQHPEPSFQESETTALIRGELERMGVEILPVDLPTGVVGAIRGTKPGPGRITALRADIDALKMPDLCGKAYASQNEGVAHACGHDGHTAILLGVAKLLMEERTHFSGTVKLVFQPAEEGIGGARIIIDAGAVDDVESIVCLHGWPYLKVGEIGALGGKYMASADSFKVKMIGQGGHGCRPYKAVNPITAAAGAICALSNLPANEVVTAEQSVVSVCTVHGGSAFNVIPDTMEFGGTVRALDPQVRDQLEAGIRRIAAGAAEMYGCRAEVEYIRGVPPLINDPALVDEVLAAGEKALGKDAVRPLDGPVMGAEDFSLYIEKLKKGVFFRLGTAEENDSEPVALHNSHFDFNDEAIPYGIATMVQLVLDQHQ